MTVTLSRRALQLLPPFATTGIGSLPHTQLELALQQALALEVPFLPELPVGNPQELMIPASLDGLPGLRFDAEGMCTVDLDRYEAQATAFEAELEARLASGELERYEPTPQSRRAWRPFLWEVEHRKRALAKVQLAGPVTVRWVAKTSAGTPVSDHPRLDRQVFQLLLARMLSMAKAVRRTGATPLLFIDEPGLYGLSRRDPRHLVVLQELKVLILALQREGALVGLHCCSNTDWSLLFELGLDIVSLDARLSLDAALEDPRPFLRFVEAGGTLSLGIVPTDLASSYRLEDLVDAVDATLRSVLGGGELAQQVLSRCLLTPACGLAMRQVVDAERIFEHVREAQRRLLGLSGASRERGLEA